MRRRWGRWTGRLARLLSTGLLLTGCAVQRGGLPERATVEGPRIGAVRLEGARHAEKPDFSGHWLLDRQASDDAGEKLEEAMRGMRERPAGMAGRGQRAGGGSAGRRGGQRARPQALGDRGPPLERMKALLDTSDRIEIMHDDPLLIIVGDSGRRQRLFTDFRGTSISAGGGLQQKVTTAAWEGNVLVVETTADGLPRLIQRYQLLTDTGPLVVSSRLVSSSLPKPVVIHRVYEPPSGGR